MICVFYELAERAMELERSGKRLIRLNIGDTGMPVPDVAIEAAKKAMDGARGYGPAAGIKELREAAAEREGCKAENIVVGPGSKHLIFALMSLLLKKGGRLAVPVPYWPMYLLAARQLDLEFVPVNAMMEDGWQFREMPQAGLAVICNPLNPASTVYPAKAITRAIEECGCPVMLDEAYKGLAFEEIPVFDCIRVRSFSKEFNMENWRLGYAAVPKEIAAKLTAYNQITATCVSNFVQQAGVACLLHEKEITERHRKIWKERKDAAVKGLRKAGFKFAEPQSGIYVFATHEEISDAGKYAMQLLAEGVAVAPGEDFGCGKFVRICLNRDGGVLAEAIAAMGAAL